MSDGELGGAAAEAQGEQQQLEGTNMAQVKFVGMSWETLEVPDLKTPVSFRVDGIVVGDGHEVMADGTIRPVARVKVQAVVPID